MIERVELETAPNPDAAVIWLHGLGADGHDFEPIVREMALPSSVAIRFIFPHAPVRPVTINNGMQMRAWYDILSFDRNATPDEAGIRASVAIAQTLIDEQKALGIAPSRIVLAGFSQGGAIAQFGGLTTPDQLAGVLALSTYLPMPKHLAQELVEGSMERNILMVHGEQDPVLPMILAEESRDYLRTLGFTVDWHQYPMAHSVCLEEVGLIRQWLLERFKQS